MAQFAVIRLCPGETWMWSLTKSEHWGAPKIVITDVCGYGFGLVPECKTFVFTFSLQLITRRRWSRNSYFIYDPEHTIDASWLREVRAHLEDGNLEFVLQGSAMC